MILYNVCDCALVCVCVHGSIHHEANRLQNSIHLVGTRIWHFVFTPAFCEYYVGLGIVFRRKVFKHPLFFASNKHNDLFMIAER